MSDGPPLQLLENLHDSNQWDRLLEASNGRLSDDPECERTHWHRAWALVMLERGEEALPNVDFLLQGSPDDAYYRNLAAVLHIDLKNFKTAEQHVWTAVHSNPEVAGFHYTACRVALGRHRLKDARAAIRKARELDPEDADIANLHIRVEGIRETGAHNAWRRIEQLEEALKLDPENASLHNSLGDVFLLELDNPKRALEYYGKSLLIDPTNKVFQKDLFLATERRNVLYRLLQLPVIAARHVGSWFRGIRAEPWRLVFVFIAAKAFAGFFVWLVITLVLFGPLAYAFRWLLLSSLVPNPGNSRGARTLRRIHRWPLTLRFVLALVPAVGIWAGLFALLGVDQSDGFTFVAILATVHLVLILFLRTMRLLFNTIGKWRANFQRRRDRKMRSPES